MCENRDIKSWNTNFMSLSSAEKLQSQYAELSTVAKELALAAIRGRKGGEILNAVRDCRNTADYTTLESDPTYQAWFRYFMQLQLQDTQIKNWLVGRAPSVDHTPHLPTGRQSSVTTDLMKSPPVGGYAQPQDANSRTFPHNSVATNVQRTSEASPIFPIQVDGMPPALEQPHSRTALEVQTEKLTHVNSPQFFSGPTQSPVDVNQLIQLLQSPMIARNNWLISCINEVLQTQQQLRQQQQHSVDPSLTMGCSAAEVQYVQRPAITRSLLSVPNVSIALVSDTNPTPVYAHATIPSVTEAPKVMSTTPQITSQYIDEKEILQNLFHQASGNVETNGTGLPNQTEKNREGGNYRMSAKEEIPNRPLSNIDPRVHETYSQQTMPRPRLRTHNRDRFLVRVLRITYQCACRPNPLVDQSKVAESRKMGCPSSECKTKKPRTYVTFQAQLPSITSSFRTSLSGNLIAPATGLRLGFTCALDSEGPSLQDFANQKVAERLDAWEQAGNLPGFRCQVLSALHDTVGLMLQRIREDGFTAVTLDSDYLFYPPSSELRPANIRPRQSSASSDSSVTRIAARNLSCVETSSTDDAKERIFTTSERIEHDSTTCVDQENPVWSELVSCVETTDVARRPRTWHQVQEATDRSPSPYGLCDKHSTNLSPPEPNHLKQCPIALHIPGCWTSRSSPSPVSCYSVSAGRTSATWTKSTDTLSPKHGSVNPDTFALSVTQRPGEVWINGRAKMLSHGRILHNDETMSTPASPTKFLNNRRLTNPRLEPNQNYGSPTTVIENPSVTQTVSTTPPTATETVVGTTEQQSQLNTVMQEIANRLRTNPHLPLVLMPTHMDKGTGTNDENRTGTPLIFQLPHPDSAFVCLPAGLHQLPRVVCASKNGTLVVIPAPTEARMNETATDPQPTIITGPRQGYILLITADNRFDYIPIAGVA